MDVGQDRPRLADMRAALDRLIPVPPAEGDLARGPCGSRVVCLPCVPAPPPEDDRGAAPR